MNSIKKILSTVLFQVIFMVICFGHIIGLPTYILLKINVAKWMILCAIFTSAHYCFLFYFWTSMFKVFKQGNKYKIINLSISSIILIGLYVLFVLLESVNSMPIYILVLITSIFPIILCNILSKSQYPLLLNLNYFCSIDFYKDIFTSKIEDKSLIVKYIKYFMPLSISLSILPSAFLLQWKYTGMHDTCFTIIGGYVVVLLLCILYMVAKFKKLNNISQRAIILSVIVSNLYLCVDYFMYFFMYFGDFFLFN